MLQAVKSATDDLQLFFRIRDDVLAKTREGRRLTELYNQHGPEVTRLLQADPGLEAEMRSLVQQWTPHLQTLVERRGEDAIITQGQTEATRRFVHHLSIAASPELRQALAQTFARHPLSDGEGKTMSEAWRQINRDSSHRHDGNCGHRQGTHEHDH